MLLRKLCLMALPIAALAIVGCDVDVNDPGEVPEVKVEGGRAPDVDVRGPDVDVKSRETEVEVPDVDINTEKRKITVPDIDVDVPEENEPAGAQQ